jgi:myosin protein heavy chain
LKEQEVIDLRRQIAQVKVHELDLIEQVQSFKQELETSKAKVDSLEDTRRQLQENKAKVSVLESQAAFSDAEISRMQAKLDEARSDSEVRKALTSSTKDADIIINELNLKLEQEDKEIKFMALESVQKEKEIKALNQALDKAMEKLDSKDKEIFNLEEKLKYKPKEMAVTKFEEKDNQSAKELALLQVQLDAKTQALKDLDAEFNKVLRQEKDLRQQLSDSKASSKAQVPALENKTSSIVRELEDANQRIEDLSSRMRDSQGDSCPGSDEYKNEVERLRNIIGSAIARLDHLLSGIASLRR